MLEGKCCSWPLVALDVVSCRKSERPPLNSSGWAQVPPAVWRWRTKPDTRLVARTWNLARSQETKNNGSGVKMTAGISPGRGSLSTCPDIAKQTRFRLWKLWLRPPCRGRSERVAFRRHLSSQMCWERGSDLLRALLCSRKIVFFVEAFLRLAER